jgi:hypothetical protein
VELELELELELAVVEAEEVRDVAANPRLHDIAVRMLVLRSIELKETLDRLRLSSCIIGRPVLLFELADSWLRMLSITYI